MTKRCVRCRRVKDADDFPVCGKRLGSWCKLCHGEYNDQRREKMKAQRRRYDRSPKGRAVQCNTNDRRRARLRGAVVENVDRQVVFDRDKGACGICGDPVDAYDWHLDHVVPLSRGGSHTYGNVQVAHPVCNLHKGANLVNCAQRRDNV